MSRRTSLLKQIKNGLIEGDGRDNAATLDAKEKKMLYFSTLLFFFFFTFLGEKVLGIFAGHYEFARDTPQQLNDQCYMVYMRRGGVRVRGG